MLKCLKIITLVFHLAFLFEYAYASRTNEEWPEFNKQQLQELAQGHATYQKNPVTDKGELFVVEKDSQATQAYKDFQADIENVESGDLKPDFDTKNHTTNLYNSKYGKIKIIVRPDKPDSDNSDLTETVSTQQEGNSEDNDPNDVSKIDDNKK